MTTTKAATVAEGDWLTYHEAATVAGCSRDTIKRRREDGAFPNARQQGDHRSAPWLIPTADLVAAGLLDASQVKDASAAAAVLRAHAEMLDLRVEIARLQADNTALQARLSDKDSEIAHLRKLSMKAMA